MGSQVRGVQILCTTTTIAVPCDVNGRKAVDWRAVDVLAGLDTDHRREHETHVLNDCDSGAGDRDTRQNGGERPAKGLACMAFSYYEWLDDACNFC